MKLATCEVATEKSGITQVNSFAIEASAKAFTILSDTLYSNKVRAVVRELSTNAYDAHVEMGIVERPFEVNLPNRFDSNFSVRDFGPGLSHEDCTGLYTTYFRSTKTNSNEAVGCLGLGSKSPFAYSDTFTVESIFEGMKRIYVANKGSSSPEFNLMHEEETDEPSGLCVKVPVRSYDYDTFKYEAQNVYSHFNVKPICNIELEYEDHKANIKVSDNNWYISSSINGNYIVMGQVAYPIKADKFAQKYEEISNFLDKINGLVVVAPIGSVEMTPSREELSYNSNTVNYIVDSLGKIVDNLVEKITKEIDDCPDIHAARLMFLEMPSYYKPNNMEYKGEVMFPTYGNKVPVHKDFVNKVSAYLGYKSRMYERIVSFHPKDTFVLNAAVSYKKERFSSISKSWDTQIVVFDGTKEDFMKIIGTTNPDVIKDLSTLHYTPRTRNSGGSIPCQMYDKSTNTFVDSKMSVKYEDAYYIAESRGDIWIDGKKYDHEKLGYLLQELELLGLEIDGDIYTVKPSQIQTSKLSERKNWTSLEEVIKEFIDKVKSDNEDNVLKAYSVLQTHRKGLLIEIKKYSMNEDFSILLDDMNQAIFEQDNAIKEIDKFLNTKYFKKHLGSSYGNVESWQFNDKIEKLSQKYYPMLTTTRSELSQNEIGYIQDMDELTKIRQEKLKESQENTCETELVVL